LGYNVKLKLPYLSKITVLKEFTNSLNQTWVNVKTSTGLTGWALKNELVTSKNDIQFTHTFNKAVVRSGASIMYAAKVYLKENESVIVLGELNGWLNVETSSGVRGWVDKLYTSPVSMKRLIAPYTEVVNGDQYVNWKKTYNYPVKYAVLSGNRLKITGSFTDIETLGEIIPGIQSIEAVPVSGSEKALIVTFEQGYTFTLRNAKDKISIKVIATGLAGKKIIIDAGHGGKDTGAIGPSGYLEKNANLGAALALKAELEKFGAIVTLTRSTDVFLELSERTYIANSSDYDAFISLHSDSYKTTSTGSTTYYNTSVNFNGPRSKGLANAIQHRLIASLDTYDRGVQEQEFYVNRMNELPSILVELAYISNPSEEKLLSSPAFRQKAAIGIRQGLEDYFNNF
ncbi:MAG: N-acetylmuramoyl-L-alanine amidase, partial [Bacillota bacterium]|nr:N-acetylmuramoyl-L-alanine amidase [Bacillota bacterium]